MIARKILATILTLEILDAEINNAIIKIFTSQVCVTSSGLNLKDTILYGQERHVESTTTHIIDQHVTLSASFLVQSICNCCRCRLVDNTQHVQPANLSSVLR